MSTTPQPIYSLLPAVFRNRDAAQGGQLAALFAVLESQYGIVKDNLEQLYDDQFIETCAPWVIPYIGELIGFDPVYTVALTSSDSRAEVANTIGYRRRKGTLLAMEQLTHDVSGRTTMVVEEFRRLITTLSLRDVRACHNATASLRRSRDWQGQCGPFSRLNRTIDVRRIAPRVLDAGSPDATPLEMSLHGGGRANIPNIAVWMWRWQSWQIANAPAFAIGDGGYFFSSFGGPIPLFQQPPAAPPPFTRLMTESDVPQPISRWAFARNIAKYYPSSIALLADGAPVPVSQILCANLSERLDGGVCRVPSGMIAIDPELGRMQYADDVQLPDSLRVTYSYGAPAAMGGGPYDRTANIALPALGTAFQAIVGTAEYPTLESAVTAWNALPAGAAGAIFLPAYEACAIDLTGPNAIQISSSSQLLIASAEVVPPALVTASPTILFTRSCVTLRGDIEIAALPLPMLPDGTAAPTGQLQINGIRLAGELRVGGGPVCVQVSDSTLIPGRTLTTKGDAAQPGEPSIRSLGSAIGASLCLSRCVTGPVALDSSCSARITASIVDAGSPWCVAFAGADLASAGAVLHIEDSTVIGRVWTQTMRLASNTIVNARLGRRDPWKAAVIAARRQVGCVRFCSLPFASLTPRRYECLPPDAASECLLQPSFITTRFGRPGYCLLSGDAPMAIWKGASNGSQMGAYQEMQETEAVTNIQIRSEEYLPANLERGVFLIPSRPEPDAEIAGLEYGRVTGGRCRGKADEPDEIPMGIGIQLL